MSLSHFIIIIIGFTSCNLPHIRTTIVLKASFPDKLSKSVPES